MDTSKTDIALVSISDDDRTFFQRLLESYPGVNSHPYVSLTHLRNECRFKKYNGVIVDLSTLICATTKDKEFCLSMGKGLALLQVRRNPDNSELACSCNFALTRTSNGAEALAEFIDSFCRRLPARGIRLAERKRIPLPVRISLGSSDVPLYASLVDLSTDGCQIASPLRRIPDNGIIWLKFDSLKDQRPIAATVCWKKESANDSKLALGVCFEELTPLQQVGIVELLKSA